MDFSKVLIAIPSKARYDRILKYTAGWLLNSPFAWKVFVEPHELALYRRVIPAKNLVVIPESNKGMHFVMNCIGKYAASVRPCSSEPVREDKAKFDYILKIDDDCRGFAVFPDLGSPAENLASVLAEIIPDFDDDATLGGVRFIQKRFWLYRKRETKKYSHINRPLWGISLYRTEAWPVLPAKVNHFDDTIHSLIMWDAGWTTRTYCKAGVDVLQNAGKGGHYSYDRRAMATESIQYVIDHMFPLCKFKENSNAGIGVDIDISAYDKGSCI
jgi:hypothetical protein